MSTSTFVTYVDACSQTDNQQYQNIETQTDGNTVSHSVTQNSDTQTKTTDANERSPEMSFSNNEKEMPLDNPPSCSVPFDQPDETDKRVLKLRLELEMIKRKQQEYLSDLEDLNIASQEESFCDDGKEIERKI